MALSVFPAHAGMIPSLAIIVLGQCCVPRTRGDDPYLVATNNYDFECSPHTRG